VHQEAKNWVGDGVVYVGTKEGRIRRGRLCNGNVMLILGRTDFACHSVKWWDVGNGSIILSNFPMCKKIVKHTLSSTKFGHAETVREESNFMSRYTTRGSYFKKSRFRKQTNFDNLYFILRFS